MGKEFNIMNRTTLLHYSQICAIPRKSILSSRSQADTSVEFCGYKFAAPIVPANMAAVVDENICKWLAHNNFFYICRQAQKKLGRT